jgi:glycosyltransferase involved in cell wall biosynthesis
MNILLLDQFSELGGGQRCLLDLLPAIAERGWRASAVLPAGGPMNGLLAAGGVNVDTFRARPYGCGRKSIGDALQYAADAPAHAALIRRLVRKNPVDLVFVNGPRMLLAAAMAVRGSVPILFHAHHCVEQRLAASLEGLLLRRSGAVVIACCGAVRLPLEKWVHPTNLHTLPNGTGDFGFRERSSSERSEIRIGIIGRVSPEKGQSDLLRAAALLTPECARLRFVVCGAPLFGGDDYFREVIRLAGNQPVEFLDWQSDVSAVMRDLDLLVIASKREGMPRVLLEAFSAGLPVVAFPVGGIPEVIDDEFDGFLVKGCSPEALAARLREVLEMNPVRLRTVARNARAKWERRYTLAAYQDRITNLMARCAARETGSQPSRRSGLRQPAPEDTRRA